MPHGGDSGELIIGLVGPVGADLARVIGALENVLDGAAYQNFTHRLSDCFQMGEPLFPEVDKSSEYLRIKTSMDAGDRLRENYRPEIMALHAAASIARVRKEVPAASHPRVAHIIRSLKRPEEVTYLRQVYGGRFILVSVNVPRAQRIANLSRGATNDEHLEMSEAQATELVVRDESGDSKYGQEMSKAFELADLFVDGTRDPRPELERFFNLVLGSPHVTPSMVEHGMFLASAASLRSGDLSRQVGAVLMTPEGTLIAEGSNDAPRLGGEPQWPGEGDGRDLARGRDSNEDIKRKMVTKILRAVDRYDENRDVLEQAKVLLGPSGILDITEFGRAVHAEMSALMACARLGVSTVGKVLFCTTFPCHNCAKHIIAAGISKLYFIEAYPKSRAMELHDDAIGLAGVADKVQVMPFVGVGPRRYVDWFRLQDPHGARVKRKSSQGGLVRWDARTALPALPDRRVNRIDLEEAAAAELASLPGTA